MTFTPYRFGFLSVGFVATTWIAAWAADLPTGGSIVAGSGTIHQTGTTLTVTQATPKLAADWQSFNIGAGHTVEFVQPSASAVAFNRVVGTDVSVIQGALRANGQVFWSTPTACSSPPPPRSTSAAWSPVP